MTEAERIWHDKSDDALIEAASELGTYTAEGQQIIRAELKRRGLEDPFEQARFTAAIPGPESPDAEDEAEAPGPQCLRCEVKLVYVGEKRFREGGNWGAMGEIGHLFEKSESYHVYACRQCGHVDFFVDPGGD
jgi:hypothetical protein